MKTMLLQPSALHVSQILSGLKKTPWMILSLRNVNRFWTKDEVICNTLITWCIKNGEFEHAVALWKRMKDNFICLRLQSVIGLLKFCAILQNVATGSDMHVWIDQHPILELNPVISTTLIDMYAKCGNLKKAQEVFESLHVRDIASWNALIAGFVHQGHYQSALGIFHRMRLQGVTPDAITLTCVLKACGMAICSEMGEEIHNIIEQEGFLDGNSLLGNALVDMYSKCGLIRSAQKVFDMLLIHNVVTWTALISGYVQHEFHEVALRCFEEMQLKGVSPNVVTCSCCLKACGNTTNIEYGRKLHAMIEKKGYLESNVVVGTALVDMYAKCGKLTEADEVFDKLPKRNTITWNSLIAGYVQYNYAGDALTCFEEMQFKGVPSDANTFSCILKACGCIEAVDNGIEIHTEIMRRELSKTNECVGNALVDMYIKCGLLAHARNEFDMLSVRNTVAWTALIEGYVEYHYEEEVFKCYDQMQREKLAPDFVTFACMFKACSNIGAFEKGMEIHSEVERKGLLSSDVLVSTALIDMYGKCGFIVKAQEVFDKLLVRSVASWNALIGSHANDECGEKAIRLFEKMQLQGMYPNVITLTSMLKACGSVGCIHIGVEIHTHSKKNGLIEANPLIGNAIVDMYAKCGMLAKAHEVFDQLLMRDITSWNALITGYSQMGKFQEVMNIIDRMCNENIEFNKVTFIGILNVCNHAGLVEIGITCYVAMINTFCVMPTIEHHACVIDLLGRSGQLVTLLGVIERVPLLPNATLWFIVLAASKKWNKVELGRQAFEQALQIDENEASAYVSMHNILVEVMP